MNSRILNFIMTVLFCAICVTASAQVNSGNENAQDPNINTEHKTPIKVIEYIPGKWVIQTVYRGKEDLTATDTLAGAETIEFSREGRYISYAGNEKIDSGAYRVNEQHSLLYLASEGDNEKSTSWDVAFDENGNMSMKIRDTGTKAESLTYVYRKEGVATNSRRDNNKQ